MCDVGLNDSVQFEESKLKSDMISQHFMCICRLVNQRLCVSINVHVNQVKKLKVDEFPIRPCQKMCLLKKTSKNTVSSRKQVHHK